MGDIKTLDFHRTIAHEAISEDGVLTIMAPGLGLTAVLGVVVENFLSSSSQGMQWAEKRRMVCSRVYVYGLMVGEFSEVFELRFRNAADAESNQVASKSTSSGRMLMILGCYEEQRAQLCSGNSRVHDITNEVTTQERMKRLP